MYLLNLQNYPDFCFPLEINGIESLADCRSSGVLLSLLLNLRNGPGVSDRVNKHWSSKEVAANWSRVIHGGMICVWEQTDGPCMFLLTLVQIFGQIKDATWLLQTECSSDQTYFLSSASSTFKSFPVFSPLFASFPQIPPIPLSPILIFIMSSFNLSFSSKWIHRHPSFLTLPDVSHIPITLSPHVRKTWVCVVSAQLWEQSSSGSVGPVVGSACGADRGPLLGNDHFSGSN